MIETSQLSKKIGNKFILENINIKIPEKKITALVGLNGAGKSSLISLISGYTFQTSGTIKKSSLSVMPDAESLYEGMSGLTFLNYIAGIKNISKKNYENYNNVIHSLLTDDELKIKMKNYSFGMKKKISFLQAYLGDFDTYIFDEPTSGVDIASAKIMMDLLLNLKKEGKAILFTSHNLSEVQEYCDYVYILKKGKIESQGDISEIINEGENQDYIVNVSATKSEFLESFLKSTGYIIDDDGNIYVKNASLKEINEIVSKMIKSEIVVKGFWNNRNLKDVVFQKG